MPKQVINKQKTLGRIKNIIKNTINIEIPTDMCNDIEIFYRTCKLDGISLNNLFTMIFDCGYHLYHKFITKNITSVPEMERVCSFTEANLESIMQLSYTDVVFTKDAVDEIVRIRQEECKKLLNGVEYFKMFVKELDINDIHDVFGKDKFVLSKNDITVLFNKFVNNHKMV